MRANADHAIKNMLNIGLEIVLFPKLEPLKILPHCAIFFFT